MTIRSYYHSPRIGRGCSLPYFVTKTAERLVAQITLPRSSWIAALRPPRVPLHTEALPPYLSLCRASTPQRFPPASA